MIEIWNDCHLNNSDKFDWLIFSDINEYIVLKNYTSIKLYLNEPKFKKCKKIYLNVLIHIDNNLTYYDNGSIHDNPEVESNSEKKKYSYGHVNYIIRGNSPNIKIDNINIISRDVKGCNEFGKEIELNQFAQIKNANFDYYYIDHSLNKSFGEEI